jgi:cytochrome c-type biogenesis protein CcmH/NrfF
VRRLAALLAAVLALAAPGAALAACPQTSVADLEDEVMCPVCGTSLATAGDAPLAVQQRRLIDRLVKQCKSKDQVKDALVAQYGQSVLAEPGDSGFRAATYLVPALALAGGLIGVLLAARRWRRGRPRPPAAAPETPDAARLDADMGRYDL